VPLLIVPVRDRIEETTVTLQDSLIISAVSLRGMQRVVEAYPLGHPLLRTTAQ
jgi:hypothetical protein